MHAELRAWLAERFGPDVAETVRILYGGSVKPENARELFAGADVDGALVGGASLSAASLLAIAHAALPGAMTRGPVALVILDGLGLAPPGPGNAVSLAHLPVFDELWETMPHTTLAASGADVGLPDGQMGNSEVGHLNLGAGRIVPQTLVRIGAAVADGTLASNPAFVAACDAAVSRRGVLHLAGLVSDGGVHSHVDHLRALVRAATRAQRAARRGARVHGRPRRLAAPGGRPAGRARARVGGHAGRASPR